MRKVKRRKTIIYVCSALDNQRLLSHQISAGNITEASKIFTQQYGIVPQTIHGPFFAKRRGVMDKTRNIQFSGSSMNAVYDGWLVSALLLKEPAGSAFLLFDRKVDNSQASKPIGTFIVNIETLQKT